jgi:hypothetical protein
LRRAGARGTRSVVLVPWIGVRLHGWLDDVVAFSYVAGMYLLGVHGAALVVGSIGAFVHFALTRCTRYPQGTWGLVSFRTHAFIELGEGAFVVATTLLLVPADQAFVRAFLLVMGASQFGAFALSDYRWPAAASAA